MKETANICSVGKLMLHWITIWRLFWITRGICVSSPYSLRYSKRDSHYTMKYLPALPTLLKIMCWVEPNFGAVIPANIWWWNLVPTFGDPVEPVLQMSERCFTIFWLQLLQQQKLVRPSAKWLIVWLQTANLAFQSWKRYEIRGKIKHKDIDRPRFSTKWWLTYKN